MQDIINKGKMNFKEFIDMIKCRPGMWIGNYDIEHLYLFLSGWTSYVYMNKVDDAFALAFKDYCSNWLHNKLINENPILHNEKCSLSFGWYTTIKSIIENPEKQIKFFFKLLDDFYTDFNNGVDFQEIEYNLFHNIKETNN